MQQTIPWDWLCGDSLLLERNLLEHKTLASIS